MMKRKDKITVSYVVDKYGYASAKLDSNKISEPFILQMNDELNEWLIEYLIKGEIIEPIPNAHKDLLKCSVNDSEEFITDTLINYLQKSGFRFHMRVTPEIADKPNRLTIMFTFTYGIIVFKVKREKKILDELHAIDF